MSFIKNFWCSIRICLLREWIWFSIKIYFSIFFSLFVFCDLYFFWKIALYLYVSRKELLEAKNGHLESCLCISWSSVRALQTSVHFMGSFVQSCAKIVNSPTSVQFLHLLCMCNFRAICFSIVRFTCNFFLKHLNFFFSFLVLCLLGWWYFSLLSHQPSYVLPTYLHPHYKQVK